MWQPDPSWVPLTGGASSSTLGVWRVHDAQGDWVVKRLAAPLPGDADELSKPAHYAFWRREPEAMAAGLSGPGLVMAPVRRIDEDSDGVTLWSAWVAAESLPGPFVARALGRFCAAEIPDTAWLCRDLLSDRLARSEQHHGWTTLARTPVADVADLLWRRRAGVLAEIGDVEARPAHGDPTPQNLLCARGDDVVATDWATLGRAAPGTDLGYFVLSAKESFDVLFDAFIGGYREAAAQRGVAMPEPAQVRFTAQAMAVYTALMRAEWALARVAPGEGPLTPKFRHPSVSRHLVNLQRQFPLIEELLDRGGALA